MSAFQIKLSKPPDGLTRKITFPQRPSWAELATRIESLYHIPPGDVGVSYVDNDGDDVTLSSEDELQDFYRSTQAENGEPGNVRLTVRDLGVLRAEGDKPLPATPGSHNYRNTFGRSIPTIIDMDDEWQRVPLGLGSVFISGEPKDNDSDLHAFVEVVESDVDDPMQAHEKDTASTLTDSDLIGTIPSVGKGKDKGKAREDRDLRTTVEDDGSSNDSVMSEEGPDKYPVHVMNMNNATLSTDDVFGIRNSNVGTAPTVEQSDSTPTPKPAESSANLATASESEAAPDPPLPDLEDIPNPTSTASLANDVANLFSTLSTVFSSHPELSEGIRNIVHNASNGTYWRAHRDAVTRAAEEIRRSAEMGANDMRRTAADAHRAAEEAAGRRVAEAIANVVRVIGDVTGTTAPGNSAASTPPVTSTPLSQQPGTSQADQSRTSRPRGRRSPPDTDIWDSFYIPGGFSRTDRSDPFSWGWGRHGGRGGCSWGARTFDAGPPPPPGPPPLPGVPLPPPRPRNWTHHPHHPHHHNARPWGPFRSGPPPPPPPPIVTTPGAWPAPPSPPPGGWWERPVPVPPPPQPTWTATVPDPPDDVEHAEVTMYGAAPSPKQSPQALKESLQAAKEYYKAEKERYRRDRDERKKERERRMNRSGESSQPPLSGDDKSPAGGIGGHDAAMADFPDTPNVSADMTESPTQIISNARGRYPQLEMFSIPPRRHHTMHGTGHRPMPSMDSQARAAQAITRRLDDMGFTPALYPSLLAKVNTRVPRRGELTKEAEDLIVTDLLEELLQMSPVKPPQASGSGSATRKEANITGAFP
ncbi:hypothetical protein AcW2_000572 [Taiwanofungus camphoratus]|nr:hypothetical protein AcW2_000572 [Antrodia cinnamomea]